MSTPVKSSDDGVLSQASDQASSSDKPPLPGKEKPLLVLSRNECSLISFVNLYVHASLSVLRMLTSEKMCLCNVL